MTKLKLFGKWTILVWLNAAVSFFFAVAEGFDSIPEVLGITCGVFTFVALYSFIDFRLLQQGKGSLRKWLLVGVIIKVFTQLLPALQMISGILSLFCIEFLISIFSKLPGIQPISRLAMNRADSFFIPYFTTVINGVILSLVVALLVFIVKLVATKLIPYFKTSQKNG
jgi:hypothetical protein